MNDNKSINFISLTPDLFDDNNSFEEFQLQQETNEIIIAEITLLGAATWLATNLAAGVVGAIGAQLWNKFIGTWSIEQLFKETSAETRKLLNIAIEELELNRAIDHITTASNLIEAYRISPEEFRLNEAEIECRRALSIVTNERNVINGFTNMLIASSLLLSILEERLIKTGNLKEIELIENTINSELNNYIDNGKEKILFHFNNKLFSPPDRDLVIVTPPFTAGRPTPAPKYYTAVWAYKDKTYIGARVKSNPPNQECNGSSECNRITFERGVMAKRAMYDQELELINQNIFIKSDEIKLKWRDFLNRIVTSN